MRLDDLADGVGILRNIETNETRKASERALIDAIFEGVLTHPDRDESSKTNTETLTGTERARVNARQESQTAVQQMLYKRAWIDALRVKGIDKIVDEPWVRTAIAAIARDSLKNVKRYSIGTLAATARTLARAGGDWSQLVPKYSKRGGSGKSRIDQRAEDAIERQLLEIKNDPGRRIVKEEVSASVRNEINSLNLGITGEPIGVPGYTTISRRIFQKFTAQDICERNRGRNLTDKLYRENAYPRDVAEFPLLISEFDDLNTGNFLIDDKNFLPFGRGFLTHGVCQNSGVPLGFDLSHEPRSYDSAIGAILDSFLPKDVLRPEFEGCKNAWIGYGNQGTILVDNASYNFSHSMKLQTMEMKLILAGVKPFGPTEKCAIEHFNAVTEKDFCMSQPGWCGDKEDPEGSKKGMQTAALTVSDFKRNYVKWVTGVYLNKSGIDGLTPKQRWLNHFKLHGPAVRWSREDIALFRLRPMLLTFRASGGIKRLNLTYNSDELIRLRQKLGFNAQVVAHIDRKDLTYVKVTDPATRALIHVPCTSDFKYVNGLTEQQQILILKMARRRGKKNPDLKEMVDARQELRELVLKQASSVKMAKRRFAQRIGPVNAGISEDNNLGERPPNAGKTCTQVTQLVTDLEWNIIQLEEVDLDLDEDSWETQ